VIKSNPPMPDPITLAPDDAKLVTLARSALARGTAAEGAAVRDDTGRTYVATTVALTTVSVSALQAAIVMAVASGARGLEAAAIVGAATHLAPADLATVAELTAGTPVVLAAIDGTPHAVVVAG